MLTTTQLDATATQTLGSREAETKRGCAELTAQYDRIVESMRMNWTTHHHLTQRLGKGGQGVVYLSSRRGADGFTLPVAIKMFSPERYENEASYDTSMRRVAHVAAHVAQIQHDNLLDVQNFVDRGRIRMMVMEWIDGYDLQQLLVPDRLARVEKRVSQKRWEYINRVLVTRGSSSLRFKAGVAVAIVRECLGALAALHREGIVHSDIKPSNVMLKRTGTAKIIDIGSAFEMSKPPSRRTCTPTYAAPEVLEGSDHSPQSDLASLGYVLIEMLAGRPVFPGQHNLRQLLELKRMLPKRLPELLPEEVTVNPLLMNFCRGLIAPDPVVRFPGAEAADLRKEGAAAFHRQLVIGDLSSEYTNEIRLWLEELKELDASEQR